MEAKDLMIGDWVRMRRCDIQNATFYTSQVLCLHKDGFLEYEPIPLTEKILKANGFEVSYSSCYQEKYSLFVNNEEDCVEYKFSKRTKDFNRLMVFIKGGEAVNIHALHVHELQHALRLCGLTELADNFKIE